MSVSHWDKIKLPGKKFLIFGIILLSLVFIFTPAAMVQFFCLFFIFIFASSKLYSEYLIRNIKVKRMDCELRVFRHEWVRIELKIENHGLLPAFMLVAGDIPGDLSVIRMTKTFCTLFRHTWTYLRWEGLCAERGVFSIGPAVIKGADPLGLFPFHLTAGETTKLYVYPSVRSINLKKIKGTPLGNIISTNPLFEDITRYRSLRPYNHGDERRRINWKASAHISTGSQTQSCGLLVNEYDAAASFPVMIFLNVGYNAYPKRNRRQALERTIEAAAALCLKSSRERQTLGIIIYKSCQDEGICVISPATFTLIPILERLSALDWSSPADTGIQTGDPEYIYNSLMTIINFGRQLSYGTRYLYVGPDLGNEAYITLNMLKKHHLSLEYLVIDEKTLLPIVPGNSPRYQIKESGYEII
ncbi:MAG: DUF58 domain-containing protein [Treponema sp.]|nr:DUF58 domain-containing protein [Treponema sp.]